jgi:CO dehydrogenase/acetyl-CoA synthase gamma subunit (corrinoid Fe-S protein)
MVFAAKLIKKEKRLEECKPLLATEHAEKWMRLKGILASA